MMSATRRKSRKRATVALGPVPQIIARIPRPYPPSAEALGALVTKELFNIWESILSDTEHREFGGPQSYSATDVEKLDALIIKQAETFGWRLGLSMLFTCASASGTSNPTARHYSNVTGRRFLNPHGSFRSVSYRQLTIPIFIRSSKRPCRNYDGFCEILRVHFSEGG
jgi:hypothetical protein